MNSGQEDCARLRVQMACSTVGNLISLRQLPPLAGQVKPGWCRRSAATARLLSLRSASSVGQGAPGYSHTVIPRSRQVASSAYPVRHGLGA